jgi:hypothetical protein
MSPLPLIQKQYIESLLDSDSTSDDYGHSVKQNLDWVHLVGPSTINIYVDYSQLRINGKTSPYLNPSLVSLGTGDILLDTLHQVALTLQTDYADQTHISLVNGIAMSPKNFVLVQEEGIQDLTEFSGSLNDFESIILRVFSPWTQTITDDILMGNSIPYFKDYVAVASGFGPIVSKPLYGGYNVYSYMAIAPDNFQGCSSYTESFQSTHTGNSFFRTSIFVWNLSILL